MKDHLPQLSSLEPCEVLRFERPLSQKTSHFSMACTNSISYLHRHPVAGLRPYTGGATSSQVYFPFLSGRILTVSTDYLSPNAKSHSFYMERPVRGHWLDENHNTLAVTLGPSCYFQSNWTWNLYQNASWVHQERSDFPTSSFLG
jgi:hypothetical protein